MYFYKSAFAGLRRLKRAGFKLVLLTNQSGVGRGYFSLGKLRLVHRSFKQALHRKGIRLDGLYYCPHLPEAGCFCRKPRPGLAFRAARDLKLDLRRSFVIGDRAHDMELARRIGARGILVLTGFGRESVRKAKRKAAKVTSNLATASLWIVADSARNFSQIFHS